MFIKNRFILLSAVMMVSVLASCSGNEKDVPENPDVGYNDAKAAYDKGDYEKASELFKVLEKEFPYSKYTKDGLLKAAYAQFETEEYDDAAASAKRYLELYPGSKESAYALHLVAMCFYNRITDPQRDQAFSLEAKKYLQDLIGRYPDSEYAADGQIKLDFVNDQLAAKDMQIGRFYLKQQQMPAAINRFKNVVKNYDTTSQIQEALYRLVEANMILGLNQLARESALLLGTNYPDSPWYKNAYELIKDNNPDLIAPKK